MPTQATESLNQDRPSARNLGEFSAQAPNLPEGRGILESLPCQVWAARRGWTTALPAPSQSCCHPPGLVVHCGLSWGPPPKRGCASCEGQARGTGCFSPRSPQVPLPPCPWNPLAAPGYHPTESQPLDPLQ